MPGTSEEDCDKSVVFVQLKSVKDLLQLMCYNLYRGKSENHNNKNRLDLIVLHIMNVYECNGANMFMS